MNDDKLHLALSAKANKKAIAQFDRAYDVFRTAGMQALRQVQVIPMNMFVVTLGAANCNDEQKMNFARRIVIRSLEEKIFREIGGRGEPAQLTITPRNFSAEFEPSQLSAASPPSGWQAFSIYETAIGYMVAAALVVGLYCFAG